MTATTRSPWPTRAYYVFFTCYLGGLLLWLVLGLVPSIAFAVPALTDDLTSAADGNGPFSGLAHSILTNRSMLPSGGWVAVQYLFSVLNLALGVLITWRRPDGVVPRLLALAFIGTAATFNEASHVVFHLLEHAPLVTAVHFTFHIVSGVAYLWAVLLFPDGRLPVLGADRRHGVWVGLVVSTAVITWVCYRSSFVSHPPFFVAFFGILVPVVGITAQTIHLRAAGSASVVRQQSRLLRIALVPAFGAALLWLGAHAVVRMGGPTAADAETFADAVQAAFPAVFAVVPVMLFVAILRYRLWDIDLVISRTLLYALLAGVVVVVYAVALALTGWLFQDQVWSTVVALTVVALVVEPARQRCRELANRLVFGTMLTPRESMRALADRLTASTSTNELGELAALVVAGTRCTSAQVWLLTEGQLVLAAAAPDEPTVLPTIGLESGTLTDCSAALPDRTCVPVVHDGRLLAVLAVTLPPRVSMPSAEAALIRDLAGHAGLLVANARLTTELAREITRVTAQAAELVTSRQLLVAAQDAERQRLERDIHDGAQQELVATVIQIRALARAAPEKAVQAVPTLRGFVASARATIEELCRGGGPAVLVDSGLPVALEGAATTARRAGLAVDIECRLADRLPAETEAAVYFCCLEALQNSAKHAKARNVVVRVDRADDEVVLQVRDDGVGFDPARHPAGSGLTNLLERTVVLGGSVSVDSSPGAGTTTVCRVPLSSATSANGVVR